MFSRTANTKPPRIQKNPKVLVMVSSVGRAIIRVEPAMFAPGTVISEDYRGSQKWPESVISALTAR